ncbi:MAG TPA: tetratricopeptide repeat protein [Planctomycetes bacterium]|nr:tetratricopeptide repeat protein [Planctomycetota bacterium]
MSDPNAWIVDADASNFQSLVIEPSRERPSVVVVWARWDPASAMCAELLEDRARRGEGRFLLAKLEADGNPELVQALGVRALPAAFVVVQGQLMRLFEGAVPEEELDRVLERVAPGGPDKGSGPLEAIREAAEDGRAEDALAALDALLAGDESPSEEALLLRIDLLLQLGRTEDAKLRHGELPEALRASAEGRGLLARIEHAEGGTRIEDLQEAVRAHPEDFDARMALGKALVAEKRYAEGFEEWLEALRLDPAGRGSEAKAALLEAFEMLGLEDPVANEYRFQLSLELFA